MFIVLVAGLGTGRWEFYFLFSTMTLLVVAAFLLNIWTFYTLSYKQELSTSNVAKGDSPTLTIHIYNNKPFSLTMMRATIETPVPSRNEQLCFNISPFSEYSQVLELPCEFRGVYSVGVTNIEIGDIFGLLRIRFNMCRLPNYRPKRLTIYPSLISLPPISTQQGHDETNQQGSVSQNYCEDGESFFDIRKYQFGDPFKRIHRIASARKRELFVKIYDNLSITSAIIIADTSKTDFTEEDSLRYADIVCECAGAIAQQYLKGGFAVTFIGSDDNAPAIECESPQDFQKLYDYLAEMEFETSGDIEQLLNSVVDKHSQVAAVFVMTLRSDDSFTNAMNALNMSGKPVKLLRPIVTPTPENDYTKEQADGFTTLHLTSAQDLF